MITEGLAREISPELIRALATAIPIGLAGGWILLMLGSLWRDAIWAQIGGAIEKMSEHTEGAIVPRWTGWRVQTAELRIDWRGGLFGPRTIVKTASKTQEYPGLMTSASLLELDLHR